MANGTIKRGIDIITEAIDIADNVSISPSNISALTKDVSKAGYTAIGLVGFAINNATLDGVGASFCYPYFYYINNDTATISVRNINANLTVKIKVVAYVLYKRNY